MTRLPVLMMLLVLAFPMAARAESYAGAKALDAAVEQAMRETGAKGTAVAVIRNGKVAYVKAYGLRNAKGDPLQTDTVMYGASLTKVVFARLVVELAQDGVIDLDRSIAEYLPKPLPKYVGPEVERKYARWSDLAGDERWRKLTPRLLLNHSSGFANFQFVEPDGKMKFHFDPGARYGYSGDGITLLQFVLEEGLGLNVQNELQRRVFEPWGMTRTSLIWRPDFAGNLADGWDIKGTPEPHDERGRVRAAGSMDTTIDDFARFAAAYISGEGLTPAMRAEVVRPQLAVTTASQFPTPAPEAPPERRYPGLASSLGLIVFDGPQGPAFFRGGHNDFTGNMWVCVQRTRDCVVIFGNDVRIEAATPALVKAALGETGAPWGWMYDGSS